MPWGSVCLAEPSPYSSQEASQQSTVFVLQQNIYLCPGCCFLEDLSLVIPFPPVSLSFFLHWLLIHAFIHSFLQSTVSPPPPHPQLSAQAALLMLHLAVSSSFAFTMPPPQPCIAIPCPTTPHSQYMQCLYCSVLYWVLPCHLLFLR